MISEKEKERLFDFTTELKKISTGLIDYFNRKLVYKEKSNNFDLQSEADSKTEEAIVEVISEMFPEYNIYGEETGKRENKSDYTFVIDPLDGTNNFSLGIPLFCTSVGLITESESVFGVIYQPFLDKCFWAFTGEGAFVNSEKIKVNDIKEINNASVSYTCGYETPRAEINKNYTSLNNLEVKRLLETWNPAYDYCMLAEGKIEAVINSGTEIYDYAAGKLIAEEAGAISKTFKDVNPNHPNHFVIANSENILGNVLNIFEN
jgi:myo-inositol-1(or 4)-monophosphatase